MRIQQVHHFHSIRIPYCRMNSSDNENEIVNLSTVHRVDAVELTYLAHCAKLINDQASPRVQSTTFFSCSNVRKINIVVGFKRVHLIYTVSCTRRKGINEKSG